jgi:hypothetical protein
MRCNASSLTAASSSGQCESGVFRSLDEGEVVAFHAALRQIPGGRPDGAREGAAVVRAERRAHYSPRFYLLTVLLVFLGTPLWPVSSLGPGMDLGRIQRTMKTKRPSKPEIMTLGQVKKVAILGDTSALAVKASDVAALAQRDNSAGQ